MKKPPSAVPLLKLNVQNYFLIGFVGHRQLDNPQAIKERIAQQLRVLRTRYQSQASGAETYEVAAVSSVATGADTLFAEAALEAGIKWLAHLPLPADEFRKDFTAAEWAHAQHLLKQAIAVYEGPALPSCATPDAASEARNAAYAECGQLIVDESDVLLAVWNEQKARGHGGSQETIAYATELARPCFIINPAKFDAFEISPAPQPAFKPAKPPRKKKKSLPEETKANEARIVEIMREPDPGLRELKLAQHYHDQIAEKHAPSARSLASRAIFLHLLATSFALSGPVLGLVAWLLFTLTLVKIAALIYTQTHLTHSRKKEQSIWNSARIKAEQCRSAAATWRLRYSHLIHRSEMFPGDRKWLRSLWIKRMQATFPVPTIDQMRKEYISGRIDDQIKYFTEKHNAAAYWSGKIHRFASISTWTAIVLGVIVLATYAAGGDHLAHADGILWLKLTSLVLPLFSAALLHVGVAHEYIRRAARNREMIAELSEMRTRMLHAETWPRLEKLIAETERLLLIEVFEWESHMRFAGEQE